MGLFLTYTLTCSFASTCSSDPLIDFVASESQDTTFFGIELTCAHIQAQWFWYSANCSWALVWLGVPLESLCNGSDKVTLNLICRIFSSFKTILYNVNESYLKMIYRAVCYVCFVHVYIEQLFGFISAYHSCHNEAVIKPPPVGWFSQLPCFTPLLCFYWFSSLECVYAVTHGNRCVAIKASARAWRLRLSSWFSSLQGSTTRCECAHNHTKPVKLTTSFLSSQIFYNTFSTRKVLNQPRFFTFCMQGARLSANLLKQPWAAVLQAFWRSFLCT